MRGSSRFTPHAHKYYEILGIDEGATNVEITKAYRKMAFLHHPDKGGDPDEFQKHSLFVS